ncbi:MAG: zinc ABC transporter substrate-binding protein [gamma proteobacterium symbiont of Bathyaustriella thionipta]|nr:zinc ABC transporter substrate-binding protein [gamma proteobacterium symbiont of Bathyaustriella thionipta]
MLRIAFFLLLFWPFVVCARPLQVFVSVPPLKTFVQKVAGAQAQVRVMLQAGHNPVTYDPTPRQISALAQTQLYIRIGVPYETVWMQRIQAIQPCMIILDARKGIHLPDNQPGLHTHHGAEEHDPHIWTSPLLAKQIAANIRNALIKLDPAQRPSYEQNYKHFAGELDSLDKDIRKQLSGLKQRTFMVFHPAWGYFAETYHLSQIAIQHEGKQTGAKSLIHLIEQARAANIKTIIVQPQFDQKSARQLARAIDGRVVAIDPLSTDYFSTLRHLSAVIAADTH